MKEAFAVEKKRRQREISIRRKKRKAFMAKALQKYFIDEAECGDDYSDDDDLAYLELDEVFLYCAEKWRRGRRGEVKCVNIFFSYLFRLTMDP